MFEILFFLFVCFCVVFIFFREDRIRKEIINRFKLIEIGMSSEELNNIMGTPYSHTLNQLKTKCKETYTYSSGGTNGICYRIYVEDGLVSGWNYNPAL